MNLSPRLCSVDCDTCHTILQLNQDVNLMRLRRSGREMHTLVVGCCSDRIQPVEASK